VSSPVAEPGAGAGRLKFRGKRREAVAYRAVQAERRKDDLAADLRLELLPGDSRFAWLMVPWL